jgi:DNA replication and repair protein RecF
MRLAWVELRDFRNHAHTRIEPVPDGLIVAVGPNGEGKTNLLEGIDYLCTLASPRVSSSLPLVREGAAAAYVRGEVETANGRVLVEVEIPTQGASRIKVNRSAVRRKRDVRRQVRAVFFGPDDLDVVRGEPSHRRRFLDEAVMALWPLKESLITAYDRTLRQRNRLLKEWDRPGVPPEMAAWDEELVASAAALMRARSQAVDRLGGAASAEFEGLAGYGLACAYAPVVWSDQDLEGAIRVRLEERRADELIRRTSLVGPHRDDLTLAVRDLGARAFASHGEAWAAALCLRIGVATSVGSEIGEPPILLVDDPFSALDPHRRDVIGERLASRDGQVVISVADDADIPAAAHATWDVRGGTVVPRGA